MSENILKNVKSNPEKIAFSDVIAAIDTNYDFTPTQFKNGDLINQANQNNGSCKIFAFALLNKLNESETLALFGHYYREDVLQHPTADDHQNIRNFMQTGWQGISFQSTALTIK